jgi:hypothetical protein
MKTQGSCQLESATPMTKELSDRLWVDLVYILGTRWVIVHDSQVILSMFYFHKCVCHILFAWNNNEINMITK